MGVFADWVTMNAATVPREAVEARFANEGLQANVEVDGWIVANSRGHDPRSLVRRLNEFAAQPVLAGWVYDSDFAYLTGSGEGGTSFDLVIGIPYTDSEEDDSYRSLVELAGSEGRRRSATALAVWSETNASTPIPANDALEILEREWTFAEEGISALFRLLGLPDLERAAFASRGPSDQPGVVISLPVHKLATLSATRLLRRVDRFSGPKATAYDGQTIAIELNEARVQGAAFDELLAEVQRWVDEVGLDRITVFAGRRAHTVERQGPIPADLV